MRKNVLFYVNLISLIVWGSLKVQAQELRSQEDTLRYLDRHLTGLYSRPEHFYYDTATISFRRESILLLQASDKSRVLNGLVTLGLLDLYARRENTAIKNFKAALAIDSGCFLCYHKLHWLYWYGKNNYGEANRYLKLGIGKFEQLVAADSGNVNTWAKLYELYKLKEGTKPLKMQQRMAYISHKLVTLEPENAYYWWSYAHHHSHNAHTEEQALLKANALNPWEAVYWNALANFYCNEEREGPMLNVLASARQYEEPDLHYWYQQKALYLYRLGKKEAAAEVYREAKLKGYDIVYKY